ncbi:hypothetical protein BDZ45DRAFT_741468 [Acephala macrosclerotiorum]|nr:hypothetical protein BDZ45DRAFT_741468 [Acephala macrosclerotiorum]
MPDNLSFDHSIEQLLAAFLPNDKSLLNTLRSSFAARNPQLVINNSPMNIHFPRNPPPGMRFDLNEPLETSKARKEVEDNFLLLYTMRPCGILVFSPSSGSETQSTTIAKNEARPKQQHSNHPKSWNNGREMINSGDNSEGKMSGKTSDKKKYRNLISKLKPLPTFMTITIGPSSGTMQSASGDGHESEAQQKHSDVTESDKCQEKNKDEGKWKGKDKGKAPDDRQGDEEDNNNPDEEMAFNTEGGAMPKCPICGKRMTDPARLSPCNHRSCRECWEFWFRWQQRINKNKHSGQAPVRCPICNVFAHLDD